MCTVDRVQRAGLSVVLRQFACGVCGGRSRVTRDRPPGSAGATGDPWWARASPGCPGGARTGGSHIRRDGDARTASGVLDAVGRRTHLRSAPEGMIHSSGLHTPKAPFQVAGTPWRDLASGARKDLAGSSGRVGFPVHGASPGTSLAPTRGSNHLVVGSLARSQGEGRGRSRGLGQRAQWAHLDAVRREMAPERSATRRRVGPGRRSVITWFAVRGTASPGRSRTRPNPRGPRSGIPPAPNGSSAWQAAS
jgi:hypothetical protein